MPSLARKILVCAAADGLVIQPLTSRGQRPAAPVKISYGSPSISAISRDQVPDVSKADSSFEAFGIIGLITVARSSFLITITRRQQVAQIRGYPIYVVTDVAVTPCASRGEAEESISGTAAHLSRIAATGADDESSSEDEGGPDPADIAVVADDPEDDAQLIGPAEVSGDADGSGAGARPRRTHRHSIAEDVIGKRGSYGRFARRWFSRAGWTIDQKRNMGLSTSAVTAQDVDDVRGPEPPALTPHSSDVSGSVVFLPEEHDESHHRGAVSLLPKLLRTTHILFGSSRSFYFSYDIDITRSVVSASSNSSYPPASSPSTTDASSTPLYRQADPLYFWNRHVTQRFVDAGMDHLVLPLMQGFVGQRTFVVDASPPQPDDDDDAGAMSESVELSDMSPPRKSGGGTTPKDGATASATQRKDAGQETLRPSEARMLMTLVSRRSVQRAGLRYLRRGVDEDGYAANTVETEQILSRASDEDATAGNAASGGKTYSFLQLRGSIPLYFTQTPYSLKPAPVLQHSAAANRAALRRHFDRLRSRYGRLLLVNLVEKHGIEAPLGEAYAQNVQAMNEEGGGEHIRLEWFDFHAACRGMKFENVTLLLESVAATLEAFGSSVVDGDGKLIQRQTGVLRTNCMDCLDRTNVCQSFFAKHMLELQLGEEGFDMSAQADQETVWFNTLWADNGDAISKQYASTAAMKGDYTRTRKRDYRGTLTDMGLSLTRFYNGMVNDYFSQAAIDFLLGNVSDLVFDEFESTMMTKDPAISIASMREQAIDTCQRRVIADPDEDLVGGWVMLTPMQPNTVKPAGQPMVEAVLLLTDAALYLCRFDWHVDKVQSFERVDLAHVVSIRFGTYITSTLSPAHTDELTNVGLVVEYQPGKDDVVRTNTRTLSSLRSLDTNGDMGLGRAAARTQAATPPINLLVDLFSGRARGTAQQPSPPLRRIALKAPYARSSFLAARSGSRDRLGAGGISSDDTAVGGRGKMDESGDTGPSERLSEIQVVVTIAAEIERLALKAAADSPYGRGQGHGKDRKSIIEKGDIVSVDEAKKSTGLLEQLGHSLKKMVWA